MPILALSLCVLSFVSLFVFRTLLQWKRTGSTGIKGFQGRIGSLPWLAGVAVGIGLVLAPLAPFALLTGWPGGELLLESASVHLAGAALTILGIAGGLWAQLSMGNSWRIGVDDSEKTRFVTTGLFAWVRNPIFSFSCLSLLGLVLLVPNVFSILAAFLTLFGIEAQVRAVEEPYLIRTHGDAYARYAASVGRFVPGLGQVFAG